MGGAVANWLVDLPLIQAIREQALARDIVHRVFLARPITIIVPLSNQVYKRVPANLMLLIALHYINWRYRL